jgi:DNA adenine methylase
MSPALPLLFDSADLPNHLVNKVVHHSPHGEVPSLLKWTGSKRSQATAIAAYAPTYERYFEPFLGGGALLYLLGGQGSQAGDIYSPLRRRL